MSPKFWVQKWQFPGSCQGHPPPLLRTCRPAPIRRSGSRSGRQSDAPTRYDPGHGWRPDRTSCSFENRGFLGKILNFFGNPGTPNPSKIEILRNFVSQGTNIPKISRNSDKFSSKSVEKTTNFIQKSQILQDWQQTISKNV